jgi:hypothetical protein
MSTLAYAQLTTRRDAAQPKTSASTSPPAVKTYVDALAALVPAEVLTLHALMLSATTQGNTITDPGSLAWALVGLLAVSVGLYAAPRIMAKGWDELDWIRVLIPPLALIGWTMLQRTTAFDAWIQVWKLEVSDSARTIVALFLAVILAAVATALAYSADAKAPS